MYILTYNFWIRDTWAGAISRIHMQFALKWDQTILCLDKLYISLKFFNDATDAASSTCHTKICAALGNGKFSFLDPLLSRIILYGYWTIINISNINIYIKISHENKIFEVSIDFDQKVRQLIKKVA